MFYQVKCYTGQLRCSSDIRYYPGRTDFTQTSVVISNLNAFTSYKFQVFSKNGVSEVAGKSNFIQINLTTNESSKLLSVI